MRAVVQADTRHLAVLVVVEGPLATVMSPTLESIDSLKPLAKATLLRLNSPDTFRLVVRLVKALFRFAFELVNSR